MSKHVLVYAMWVEQSVIFHNFTEFDKYENLLEFIKQNAEAASKLPNATFEIIYCGEIVKTHDDIESYFTKG